MPQTPEDRIKRHYKAIRRSSFFWNGNSIKYNGMTGVFYYLARWWKRPIKEIKRIVGRT